MENQVETDAVKSELSQKGFTKKVILSILILTLLFFLPSSGLSLEGFDYDTGDYVEIEERDSFKPGMHIVIFDYADQSYHDVEIISFIRRNMQELEVYDYDTEEYRSFEMDGVLKGHESAFIIDKKSRRQS
jgi:hypothetical protein